jgi:hypothetical protein
MTDLQLLLSIGSPSLLIALSMLSNNSRFNSMDKRMDGMDSRLNKLDADLREFRVEHRQDLVAIHADLKQFYGMTTKLEGRMDEISKR